jgi:hypothetical protein
MILTRFAALALASAFATAAWAESNTMTGKPGFFRPTPDGNSSISQTLPETLPDAAKKAVADVMVDATPVVVEPKRRARAVREAEPELDRAQAEHEQMRERSVQNATTVQGAFNGATNERDR